MDERMQEFKKLVEPLYAWLRKNYCPHDAIIIEYGQARVVSDSIGVPLEDSQSLLRDAEKSSTAPCGRGWHGAQSERHNP
jgi:hypothetical protein